MVLQFEQGKLLSTLSTLGIGGPARAFIEVDTIPKMQEALRHCHAEKLPFLILGKGSNCLFDDRGFDGVVIANKIAFCTFQETLVPVGAGYSFSLLGTQTARKGLAGLEFASGIPGTVGGAVFMNAGANGQETCNALIEVQFVDEEGSLIVYKRSDLHFAYRTSCFQQMKGAIVGATFQLEMCPKSRAKQLGIIDYRTKTQPYSDKSAGCVFRNPPAHSAGALIQQCGLKGKKIGGAEVSPVHANFLINRENATAKDILELAQFVKQVVKEQTGVDLDMEIRHIPHTC